MSDKKFIIQIDKTKNPNIDNHIDAIKTSSSASINKEIDTDKTKIISLQATSQEMSEILDNLPNKDGVVIEENQKFHMLGNVKTSKIESFLQWLKTFLSSDLTNKSSVYNTPSPRADLAQYALKKNVLNRDVNRKLWNIKDSRCDIAWEFGYTGKGIRVAIIDTGSESTHHALIRNISVNEGINTVGSGLPTNDFEDRKVFHGIHVSGTVGAINEILGYAPECTLIPIKVLGDDGTGDMDDIIEGLEFAYKLDVDVVNMSLGGGSYSKILHDTIKRLHDKGTVIVVAAGNESSDVSYPAKYDEVIPVASYNKYNKISSFSNHGPDMKKGVCAPGEQIYSTWGHDSFNYDSGTSMACPAVAGAAALLKEIDPQVMTPEKVRQAICNGAVDTLGVPIEYQGNGKLDVPNAIIAAHKSIVITEEPKVISEYPRFYRGCYGDLIEKLQIPLYKEGFYKYRVDGIYGQGTANAVKEFSKSEDFVNPETWTNITGTPFPDIFERSLQITAAYEDTGYTKLVGNFDDAILTFGIIGFTVKFGSLPALLNEACSMFPAQTKLAFGNEYPTIYNMCQTYAKDNKRGIKEFSSWGLSIQKKSVVDKKWRDLFNNFGSMPEIQKLQRDRARIEYWSRSQEWADKFGVGEDLSLALCFDCAVQGFKSVGIQEAQKLTSKSIDSIVQSIQITEASKGTLTEKEKRQIIATVNAETCNPRWRDDVWTRKSSFIDGLKVVSVHDKNYVLSNWGFCL